jgi:restriction system protein
VVGSTTPQQPNVIHVLIQAVGPLVTQFWWVVVLVGAVALGRGIKWVIDQRRLVRSGIDEIDRMDGISFERRLDYLFAALGYRVEQTRVCGDYGADLVLEKDAVRSVVQAKCWKKNVGVKAVQEVVAAKPMYRCTRAIAVTNRYFTQEAQRLARANEVELWNRDDLIRALLRASEAGGHEPELAT